MLMPALQKVAVVLLQLFAVETPVPIDVNPVLTPKVLSMSVVKDSLKEHRTDLFRFNYPDEGTRVLCVAIVRALSIYSSWRLYAVSELVARRGF